jgi:hypothetical protein
MNDPIASSKLPPKLEHVMTLTVAYSNDEMPAVSLWNSGAERRGRFIAEGQLEGPGIAATVIPSSGGDWPIWRPDGVSELDARYMLRTDDGVDIYVQNRGYRWGSKEVMAAVARKERVDAGSYYMRVTPKFDVAPGRYDWLGRYVFLGVAEKLAGGNTRIEYFKVL